MRNEEGEKVGKVIQLSEIRKAMTGRVFSHKSDADKNPRIAESLRMAEFILQAGGEYSKNFATMIRIHYCNLIGKGIEH